MFKNLFLLFVTVFLVNCSYEYGPETIVSNYRGAVGHLTNNSRSCSAFHIGNGIMITAKHCLGDQATANLIIKDSEGESQPANILFVDPDEDVAILGIEKPLPQKLKLWNKTAGKIAPGHQIITMGFPGYYLTNFTFEVGYTNGSQEVDGSTYIMSKEIAFAGESGGPVVSVKTGYVIGLADMMSERIQVLDLDGTHQHRTISMILPWNIIEKAIIKAKLDYIL